MDSANLKPRQQKLDNFSDSQTFGTLIKKWEETRPLPDVDKELEDVDKIGLMIDVFFKGHLCKMLDIKNTFSHIYEKYIAKYTVKKPEYYDDDDSETLFEKIFGSASDDE